MHGIIREDGAPSEHSEMYRLQAETAYRIAEKLKKLMGLKVLACVGSTYIRFEIETRMNWPLNSQSLIPKEEFDRRVHLTPMPGEVKSLLFSYIRRILTNGAEWVVADHVIVGECA